ncbi:translation initiation factor IF-2 N-terminal domain-containing protein [Aliarcobacter butzleri]|uniref:translation initiation factor IF-2 N-terminal domain-containing protein n=1 Tax=Aliarcobacter butzleri TaxID=28197 RepID=UPI003AF59EB8
MPDKVRVFEIAEEAATTSVNVMQKAKELGIDLKTVQASVSYEDAEEITLNV